MDLDEIDVRNFSRLPPEHCNEIRIVNQGFETPSTTVPRRADTCPLATGAHHEYPTENKVSFSKTPRKREITQVTSLPDGSKRRNSPKQNDFSPLIPLLGFHPFFS